MKQMIRTLCLGAFLAAGLAVQAAETANTSFFKIDAGLSIVQDIGVENIEGFEGLLGLVEEVNLKADPGVRVDFSGGYNFSKSWAIELEAGLIYNSLSELEAEAGGMTATEDLDMNFIQIPVLVNVIYRIPLESKFKPYLGAGAGGVFSIVSGDDVDSESDFAFAFQGMAGIDYELSENTDIGIGYKFLGALGQDFGGVETDNIYTHAFLLGFNFRF